MEKKKTSATLCYDNYRLFTNNGHSSYTHTLGELLILIMIHDKYFLKKIEQTVRR